MKVAKLIATAISEPQRDEANHKPDAGGFGPPGKRERATIGRDVLDGYVSSEGARRDYGISDPEALRRAVPDGATGSIGE